MGGWARVGFLLATLYNGILNGNVAGQGIHIDSARYLEGLLLVVGCILCHLVWLVLKPLQCGDTAPHERTDADQEE